MTAIQYNLITGEPVLFAPGRAARPNAFAHDSLDVCPFCPGNESMTPAEVARLGSGGKWSARAFPNKYPATPHHEVIVESPDHDAHFGTIADAPAVTGLLVDRYRDVRSRAGVAYASLFKNSGAMAGASLDHTHSQLIAVPVVPPRIAREAAAFEAAAQCPLCACRGALIRETAHFTWFAPPASIMAYEQWIVPKRHLAEPSDLQDAEIAGLAALLQSAASGMTTIAPSFNWSFVSFPMTPAGHFYVQLFPRMTSLAGFELGTSMFIDVVDPATTVRRLKGK